MDKQPVGTLPDLTASSLDDEIMVITDSEHNQLKKEKISDLITDFTSTNENNALTKGTDGKMFVTDFGNASNITEGTLPVEVLPESGVTADTYAYPSSVTVNAQGQVTAIEEGSPSGSNANTDLSNITEAGKEVIRQNSGAGMPVGTIFAHTCSADFVPENSLPCNGSEYTESQFPNLYVDWLISGRLNTCTYEEYQQDIDTYGKCAKFGLDSTSGKFKVPTIPDGTHIQQAMSYDELGKSYNAGLPNIEGSFHPSGPNNNALMKFGASSNSFVDGAFYLGNQANCNTAQETSNSWYGGDLCFDASRSNPIYSNDVETVQTEAVALRYFVVVATGAINQSEIDWSEWATGLQGKANVDMNNLSTTGKAEVTSYAFPSSKYIDLTVGASGETYVAPDNGIFCVGFSHPNNTEYINYGVNVLDQNNNFLYNVSDTKNLSGQQTYIIIQIKKGHKLRIYFGNFTVTRFRFIYAQGVSND